MGRKGANGKQVATSSTSQNKRTKRQLAMVTERETRDEMEEDPTFDGDDEEFVPPPVMDYVMGGDGLPIWELKKSLDEYPVRYQARMYVRKLESSTQPKPKLCIAERMVADDLDKFGIKMMFERLGWGGVLSFGSSREVQIVEIVEWLSVLKKIDGSNPPVTTKLVGRINKNNVELSFDTMDSMFWLNGFDTGSSLGAYEYPSDDVMNATDKKSDLWKEMMPEVFVIPPDTDITKWTLRKENLKVMAMILLKIIKTNLMPRTSDTDFVREYEVIVLYALMTGRKILSCRHIIMNNIWSARVNKRRFSIPHVGLLSQMLMLQGGIKNTRTWKGHDMPVAPWTMKTIKGKTFVYKKTSTKHRLSVGENGPFIEAQLSDVEEDATDEDATTSLPVPRGFAPHQLGSPYVQHLQNCIVENRPDGFDTWPEYNRLMFDGQSQAHAATQVYQETMMRRQEEMRNDEFLDNEARRHDMDYDRGWEYTVRPRPVDWQNHVARPYDETHRLPRYVQTTPSRWVDPYSQQQGDQGASSSSSGAFDMRAVGQSFLESVFGAPYQPPPYDG